MGRETKIGLLVGMCFIVCFAIILSHRGNVADPMPVDRFEVDVAQRDSPEETRRIADHVTDLTIPTMPTGAMPEEPSDWDEYETQVATGYADETAANSANRFNTRAAPLEGPSPAERALLETQSEHGQLVFVDESGQVTSLSPESSPFPVSLKAGAATRTASMDASRHTAERVRGGLTSEMPSQAEPASAAATTPAIMASYVIEAGDTLTRIARRNYHSVNKSVIDQIYAANRGTLPSPDLLVPGKTILLPVLEGMASAGIPSGAPAGRRVATPTTESTSQPTRSSLAAAAEYTPQPGDTLTSIARSHYRSSSRQVVDAIYQANRDVLSSPDALVVGRKIKLPVLDSPATANGRSGVRPVDSTPVKTDDHDRTPPRDRSRPAGERGREGIDWEWYQLEKGDVYTTVAAQRLGTSKRWHELAEFNKDIFPDPSRIRHGVRIRIPIDSEKTARRTSNGDV